MRMAKHVATITITTPEGEVMDQVRVTEDDLKTVNGLRFLLLEDVRREVEHAYSCPDQHRWIEVED